VTLLWWQPLLLPCPPAASPAAGTAASPASSFAAGTTAGTAAGTAVIADPKLTALPLVPLPPLRMTDNSCRIAFFPVISHVVTIQQTKINDLFLNIPCL
jgi:hypothetical protein